MIKIFMDHLMIIPNLLIHLVGVYIMCVPHSIRACITCSCEDELQFQDVVVLGGGDLETVLRKRVPRILRSANIMARAYVAQPYRAKNALEMGYGGYGIGSNRSSSRVACMAAAIERCVKPVCHRNGISAPLLLCRFFNACNVCVFRFESVKWLKWVVYQSLANISRRAQPILFKNIYVYA